MSGTAAAQVGIAGSAGVRGAGAQPADSGKHASGPEHRVEMDADPLDQVSGNELVLATSVSRLTSLHVFLASKHLLSFLSLLSLLSSLSSLSSFGNRRKQKPQTDSGTTGPGLRY